LFSVLSGLGSVSGEGTPDSIREKAAAAVSEIRERWRRHSWDRGVSVMLGHKTDMMDNHYKTSMSVK
jgi:hypothetical protein